MGVAVIFEEGESLLLLLTNGVSLDSLDLGTFVLQRQQKLLQGCRPRLPGSHTLLFNPISS